MKPQDDLAERRHRLVGVVSREARETTSYHGREGLDARVLAALERVPRHLFVPESRRGEAYANHPLPIGQGQTISQPYIVALMTELLDLHETDVVLEIGTGSGYQAAVLAELVRRVYSVEVIESLAESARETLRRLGYRNVEVRCADGNEGWLEHAPFDAIIVTAAASEVPRALVAQLREGGKMVIPLERGRGAQELMLLVKRHDGGVDCRPVLPVAFVPLVKRHA